MWRQWKIWKKCAPWFEEVKICFAHLLQSAFFPHSCERLHIYNTCTFSLSILCVIGERGEIRQSTKTLPKLCSAFKVLCCSATRSCLLFATPRTVAHQASLSSPVSWSLVRFMYIELVVLSNHIILCCSQRLLIFLLATWIPACDSTSLAFHMMYSS